MKVTGAQLKRIVGGAAPLAVQYAAAFNEYKDQFGVNTYLRVAHFWAQVGHECKLRYVREEWGPTQAQRGYEGRKDLGNTQPGDGKRFMGHGALQVTGRGNHAAFTAWARKLFPDCPDFEADPEKLTEFPWAILGAFWYWETRKLNALADKDDVLAISIKINGKNKRTGLPNGLEDRKAILARAKKEFGVESVVQNEEPKKAKPKDKVYGESLLTMNEIKYIQDRLIALGYHEVGFPDGIWGSKAEAAVRLLQTRAKEMGMSVTVDGHYGPQTKDLIDPIYGDRYRKHITLERAQATVGTLIKQGNPAVIKSRKIKFASIFGVLSSLGAAAFAAYQAPADLPTGSSIFLAFLPPHIAAIVSSVAPYLITFVVSLYTTYKAQGVVDSSVERVREGIDNSGLPSQLDHDLGGFFSKLLR